MSCGIALLSIGLAVVFLSMALLNIPEMSVSFTNSQVGSVDLSWAGPKEPSGLSFKTQKAEAQLFFVSPATM